MIEDKNIWHGDCLKIMDGTIENGTVDLVATDPPFNIGYRYDLYNDGRPRTQYLAWTEVWLELAKKLLKPTGSMWVAIGDEYAAEMKIMLDHTGMTMRNWVIWHYTFGVACHTKFSRSHAHLFYYVMDPKNHTFNADAVRVMSARQSAYGDSRANQKGKLPDDTWILRPIEEDHCCSPGSDTWLFSRVCGTFHERTIHPCQIPEALLKRIIAVSSNPGDLVLDPFSGSFTTCAVAKRLGRKYIGIELSEDYCKAGQARLAKIQELL